MIKNLKKFFKPDPQLRNWTLYVLKLQHGKYYIGITSWKDPQKRISQHGTPKGAQWTSIHKPLETLETRNLGKIPRWKAEAIENNETIKRLLQLGLGNVRGGHNTSKRKLLLPQFNPGSWQDILQIGVLCIILFVLIIVATT